VRKEKNETVWWRNRRQKGGVRFEGEVGDALHSRGIFPQSDPANEGENPKKERGGNARRKRWMRGDQIRARKDENMKEETREGGRP